MTQSLRLRQSCLEVFELFFLLGTQNQSVLVTVLCLGVCVCACVTAAQCHSVGALSRVSNGVAGLARERACVH